MSKKSKRTNTEINDSYSDFKKEAIAKIYAGQPLTGKNGVFRDIIKDVLETALSEELNQHLSENEDQGISNRRNGYNSKKIKNAESSFSLNTPRDRNSSFDPQIVKKGQTVLTEDLDNKIIAMYGRGMSYRDISDHLEDMYGIDVSKSSITAITDKVLPKIKQWQSRPLDEVYPIIFFRLLTF